MTMADQGFQADPAKIAQHAADFPGYADRVGAIHDELSAALADAGPCWGDDPAGQSFAADHVAPASATLNRLAGLPGRLGDVGDRFTATARSYQRTEESNARLLSDGDR